MHIKTFFCVKRSKLQNKVVRLSYLIGYLSDICVINSKVFDLLPQTARLGKKVFHPGKEERWQKKEKEPRCFPNVRPSMPAIFICSRGVKKAF